MSEEQGIVVRLRNPGIADVMTEKGGGCESCSSAHSCHAFGTGKMITRARNRVDARIGDQVSLELSPGLFVGSAAMVYLLPVVGFIIGAVLGSSLHEAAGLGATAGSVWFGFGGLALGFLITLTVSRRSGARGTMTPEIAKILARGKGGEIVTEVDPVCDMIVDPTTSAASLGFQGKTYYFCNPACKEMFIKDPKKYVR